MAVTILIYYVNIINIDSNNINISNIIVIIIIIKNLVIEITPTT